MRRILEQLEHVLAGLLLVFERKYVEKHSDVNYIPRSSQFRQVIHISKYIPRNEVRGVKLVLVLEKTMPSCLKGGKYISTIQT
jgi:hypothetical protein